MSLEVTPRKLSLETIISIHVFRDLVPGDIVSLPVKSKPYQLTFDAVLLSGSCIVNESMLTGRDYIGLGEVGGGINVYVCRLKPLINTNHAVRSFSVP